MIYFMFPYNQKIIKKIPFCSTETLDYRHKILIDQYFKKFKNVSQSCKFSYHVFRNLSNNGY